MLVLADGTRFQGESFGFEHGITGEVIFSTAMAGYPETLTDPAYAGQIVVLTYPLIGNYGVPANPPSIKAAGLIVGDYSEEFSHWNAETSLGEWLKAEQIPALAGIDTRALTKHLREHGVMAGSIIFEDEQPTIGEANAKKHIYGTENLAAKVSCAGIQQFTSPEATQTIVLVDLGTTQAIIDAFTLRGINVVQVPWDYDFNTLTFDGLVLSSGPGDPRLCEDTLRHLRAFLYTNEQCALLGIGLGHQLLCQAVGASIHKLPYGHHGHNQPVRMVGTEKCFITHQNHGYVADTATLQEDWVPSFINMNDNTNEGIRHINKPWCSVQFTPDTTIGVGGTEFLIKEFIANLKK